MTNQRQAKRPFPRSPQLSKELTFSLSHLYLCLPNAHLAFYRDFPPFGGCPDRGRAVLGSGDRPKLQLSIWTQLWEIQVGKLKQPICVTAPKHMESWQSLIFHF